MRWRRCEEQVADRQIRGGLAIGGRAALQQKPALGARRLGELTEEAGLPHPGLPDDRHHLAVPRPCPLQGLVQGREFRLPPHEGGQPPRPQRLQARAGWASAHQLAHLHGIRQALDGHRAQGDDLHQPLRQPQGLGRQPNGAGGRELFHTSRQVRGLADGRVVHVQIVADGAHDHLPRVEADPDLHLEAMPAAHLLAVTPDRLLHGQGGIAGPYGVVFMGNRRPKQGHNPIAQDLVHGPFIAVHGRHHALQHRVENLTRLLGVAVGQQCQRAFEIGKQYRDLLTFAFQGAAASEDFLGEVRGRVGVWGTHWLFGRRWRPSSGPRPDQHFAIFVHGEALGLDDLRLQVFEVVVIKCEAALERAIGDAPLALEEVERLGEDFVERHLLPRCLRIENVRRGTARSLEFGRKCRELGGASQLACGKVYWRGLRVDAAEKIW